MVTVLKRAVLRSLEQRGYVLLKKAEYDDILAAAAARGGKSLTPATPEAAMPRRSAASPASPLSPLPPNSTGEFTTDSGPHSESDRACGRLEGKPFAMRPLAEMQQAPPGTSATSVPIEIERPAFESDDGTVE